MRKLSLAFLILTIIALQSCNQPEGEGGTASIKGKITVKYYNDDFSILLSEEPAFDENVFISYGRNGFSHDETETGYNGLFRFDYLFAGDYQIFYYSLNPTDPSAGEQPVVVDFSLASGQEHNLGEMYLNRIKDWDEGNAIIKGQIYLINYKNESVWPNYMIVKDTSYAQDVDVYMVYGNHLQFDERIRTMDDGSFAFTGLIKGNYRIFVYSEDLSGATQMIPVERTASITQDFQETDLGIIYIEQL